MNHRQLGELLGLPRCTNAFYLPPTPCVNRRCGSWPGSDALYLARIPASGSRRMVDYLAREGIRSAVSACETLMRRMGLRI